MTTRRSLIATVFLVNFTIQGAIFSYALEKDSHKLINEFIAKNDMNGFSLNSYIKKHLGFSFGTEERFNCGWKTKKIWDWMAIGGKNEDEPITRSVNHFHNPLESNIEDAGFSGIWGRGLLPGDSAIEWSQKDIGVQSLFGRDYSWFDTRDYFFKALTSSTKEEQEKYYAKIFRVLAN